MSRLTRMQRRFVEEYLVDPDAEAAACRAGYCLREAGRAAARNMEHEGVLRAIRRARAERSERTRVTQDAVVRELAAIGFATMRDVCRWSGETLELHASDQLSAAQVAAIAEIAETSSSRGVRLRVKLHSKLKALEMLARHVGLYEERREDGQGAPALPDALREKLDALYAAAVVPQEQGCTRGEEA